MLTRIRLIPVQLLVFFLDFCMCKYVSTFENIEYFYALFHANLLTEVFTRAIILRGIIN